MNINIRKLELKDFEILLTWRNHVEVSSNSYNQGVISLKDHKIWFEKILNSKSIFTYILEFNQTPVGVIRFENESSRSTKINYLIDPNHHGKGLGTEILKLGIEKNKVENQDQQKFHGFVLKSNTASIKIFEKLHFKKVSENDSELKFEKTVK